MPSLSGANKMYKLIEPYRAYVYIPFVKSFNKSIYELQSRFKLENIDCSDISSYIGEILDQIHLPDFVIRFDKWLRTQQLTVEDRYKLFFKDKEGKWKNGLRYNNEYITALAEYICNSTLKNIETFFSRLISEQSSLINKFNCPPVSTKGSISIIGGDRHNNGQQPVLLKLGEFKLIYKPRDSGTEKILNDICLIIGCESICPETLSMKTHIWQKFIENNCLSSIDKAKNVYRKYGNILALADMLNINDCHFENFIVDDDNLWFIDSETSFQYYFTDNPEFEKSIYQSGLLQNPSVFETGIGHTSAITAVTNIFKSFTYPHAINDGSENIQVRYERGFIKNTHHVPHYQGVLLNAKKYSEYIIRGYTESFYAIKSKKNEIFECINSNSFIKPRYLIRTTAYYLLVINKIIHPDNSRVMPNALAFLTDEFLHYNNANPLFTKLIPYEIRCLANYDIPIFNISINSKSLFDGDGKEYFNFFPCTPLQQIDDWFCRDDNYLKRQNQLIHRSIHAQS